MDFGTLADGLGCFPFANGAYPPLPDCQRTCYGIRSLIRFGSLVGPLAYSVLYPRNTLVCLTLALKLFRREPDIAEFDWPFTPYHRSSK
jgi:hypothetical protein